MFMDGTIIKVYKYVYKHHTVTIQSGLVGSVIQLELRAINLYDGMVTWLTGHLAHYRAIYNYPIWNSWTCICMVYKNT